jgi:bacterioferritin-associated ferredoxin
MSKIICSCYKVTKEDIKKAIKNGASSFKEIKDATKITKSCGKCRKKAKKVSKKLIKKANQ